MKLQRSDFKKIDIDHGVSYLSWKGKHCEICVEAGFGCLYLAVYNLKNQYLLEPKVNISTNSVRVLGIIEYFKIVDKTVNDFYQKWEIKK